MAKLLFRLANVPQSEAECVRQRLTHADIDWYETSAGRWGMSLAAIWLADNADYERARSVIDEYQQELSQQPQEPVASLAERIRNNPLEVLLIMIAVSGVLVISLLPFLTAFQ